MTVFWTPGDVSGAYALTDDDHWYPSHINELRRQSGGFYNAAYYGTGQTMLEVQLAVDAAVAAGGGVVYIPAGTWTKRTPRADLFVNSNNITLVGDGRNLTILEEAIVFGDYVSWSTELSNLVVRDLAVDFGTSVVARSCVWGMNVNQVRVENCRFKNLYTGAQGIFLRGSNITVQNCSFTDCSAVPILLGRAKTDAFSANNNKVLYNYIVQATSEDSISFDWCVGGQIIGNYIDANNLAYIGGFPVKLSGGCRSVIVNNNYIFNLADNAMAISPASDGATDLEALPRDCIVSSNHISNTSIKTGTVGIFIASAGANPVNFAQMSNTRVIGNDIKNMETGISLWYDDYSIVTENQFTTCTTPVVTLGTLGDIVRNNTGHITENSGTGTIASGATTAVITHGLSVTPTLKDITITLGELSTTDPGQIYITAIGATTFTVNCRTNPGVSGLDFAWQAIVL